jgi:hypothetical protein
VSNGGESEQTPYANANRGENAEPHADGVAAADPAAAGEKPGNGARSKSRVSALERLKQMALDDEAVVDDPRYPPPAGAAGSEPRSPDALLAVRGGGAEGDNSVQAMSSVATPVRGQTEPTASVAGDTPSASEHSTLQGVNNNGVAPSALELAVGSAPGAKVADGTQSWDLAIKFDFMVRIMLAGYRFMLK